MIRSATGYLVTLLCSLAIIGVTFIEANPISDEGAVAVMDLCHLIWEQQFSSSEECVQSHKQWIANRHEIEQLNAKIESLEAELRVKRSPEEEEEVAARPLTPAEIRRLRRKERLEERKRKKAAAELEAKRKADLKAQEEVAAAVNGQKAQLTRKQELEQRREETRKRVAERMAANKAKQAKRRAELIALREEKRNKRKKLRGGGNPVERRCLVYADDEKAKEMVEMDEMEKKMEMEEKEEEITVDQEQ